MKVLFLFITAVFTLNSWAQNSDLEQADNAFANQNWDHAIQRYQSHLTATENAPAEIFSKLGQSHFHLQQYPLAIQALQQALQAQTQGVEAATIRVFLARSFAATQNQAESLAQLTALASVEANVYLAVKNAPEFQKLENQQAFHNALAVLHPCSGNAYRAFDFWVGQWEVTTPSRPGWKAQSQITRSNDGCSIHEHYQSPAGYQGHSINFYDANKQQWVQTWMDNQGSPLYLTGDIDQGEMVLEDDTNRITWRVLDDGRVQQLWQSRGATKGTWNTIFNGYYLRTNP